MVFVSLLFWSLFSICPYTGFAVISITVYPFRYLVDPLPFIKFAYMRYAFSALVRNQMIGSTYTCGPGCECMFVTSLLEQCMIDGSEAAAKLGYGTENWLSYVSPLETWVFGSVTFGCVEQTDV